MIYIIEHLKCGFQKQQSDKGNESLQPTTPPNTACTRRWGLPLRGVPYFRVFSLGLSARTGWLRVFYAPTCACGKMQAGRVHTRPSAMLRERKPLGG